MAGGTLLGDTCWLEVRVLLSGDADDCGSRFSPSRSLKYSESLREELRPSRSSALVFTSAHGQS